LNNKVSFKEKFFYGVGDAGCNFVWTTMSIFMMVYYTDNVKMSAALIGTIMLIARLFDGFTDIGMGLILDRTKTRWGKARPWLLWSAPFMTLGLILIFNVPSSFSSSAKIIYIFITYVFVADFAYTASNLSYNTLLALVTPDQNERTSMSTIRFICTMIAVLIISYFTLNIVSKVGWLGMSLIYGAITLVLLLIPFFGTKERCVPIKQDDKKIPIKTSFKVLMQNRHFIVVTIIFVINYAAMSASSGVGIYYARDVMGNIGVFGTLMLAGILPLIFGLPLFPLLAGKFGKWKCMLIGYLLEIGGLVLMIFNPASVPLVIVGSVIKGLGGIPHTAGLFAMVADVVDFGEWKTNIRIDGLTYSATSFGMKAGTGLGSALVGWILAYGNYNGSAAVQSASAILSMKVLYIYLPIGLYILGFIALLFSNIDKIYPKIAIELEERRQIDIS
jgi:glycoside/pentoside/hexuronide:cation symporter, GPH family